MLKIITDSASDLPKDYIKEHNLQVIPTPVVIDDVDYLDGLNIQTKEFYDILDDTKKDVRTYHINPSMFEEAFLPYAEAGDTLIYLCFSTGIAGTFNAANIAKTNVLEQYPDFDLTIIDSKCASIGFGLVVTKLVNLLEKGASKDLIIEAADFYIAHIHHVFTVHTLAYLVKGGRLSKFKGALAETLDMKPILIVDEAGSLQVIKTVRGRKKSLKTLVDYVKENGKDISSQTLAFCHGEDDSALQFLLELSDELHPKDKLISTVGCAIGAHTGRGIVAICFFDELNDKFEKYQ